MPTYRRQRAVWIETVQQSALPAVAVAARALHDNTDEDAVLQWMVKGGGKEAGMHAGGCVAGEGEVAGGEGDGSDQSQKQDLFIYLFSEGQGHDS